MSNKFEGLVKRLHRKDGTNRRGAYSTYSALIVDSSGTETWVGFGFDEPPFNEGDTISVLAEENDAGYLTYVKGSGKKITPPKQEEPPKKEPKAAPAGNSKYSSNDPARQMSIVMQHSQEMAISMTNLLLTHGALPLSKTAGKTGEAVRFTEVLAMVDKLTVKYYNDATSDRVIKTVADMGVVTHKPDTDLPDAKKPAKGKKAPAAAEDDLAGIEPSSDDGFDDDIPF